MFTVIIINTVIVQAQNETTMVGGQLCTLQKILWRMQ